MIRNSIPNPPDTYRLNQFHSFVCNCLPLSMEIVMVTLYAFLSISLRTNSISEI